MIPVKAASPYPELKVEGRNIHYAAILTGDLASATGEMTAIYQYLYQHWTLQEQFEEIAQTIVRISEVEMHHLNMLGSLIDMLGGNPKCEAIRGYKRFFWQGSMVNYSRELPVLLKSNIYLEQSAVREYLEQADYIEDPYVSAVLARMAEDEEIHYAAYQDFLAEYIKSTQ